ncbi:MAG: ZIP family metal transporter [Candidatus Bipolaricaulia bacterium]
MAQVSAWDVLWFASLTAIATGLGALPFALTRGLTRRLLGIANALASGLMLGASFGLLQEGLDVGLSRVMLGALIGLGFIVWTKSRLDADEELTLGALRGVDARKALLIVGVMTVHSFTEGVGVGVSFGGGEALGLFVTIAIAVHNIPEGLAISLVLIPRGVATWKAAGWSVFSSLPQPLMAVPAFLLVETFRPVLPVGLGFAAGAMLWMVFSELIPEAIGDASRNTVAVTVTIATLAMIAFQVLLRG